MASLGYKSSENPLNSPNQTQPYSSSLPQNPTDPLHFFISFIFSPAFSLPLWPIDGGGGQSWLDRRGFLRLPLPSRVHHLRSLPRCLSVSIGFTRFPTKLEFFRRAAAADDEVRVLACSFVSQALTSLQCWCSYCSFSFEFLISPTSFNSRFPASSGRRPAVEKLLPAFLNSVSLFLTFCHVDFWIMLSFELRVLDVLRFLKCLCFNIEIKSLNLSILWSIWILWMGLSICEFLVLVRTL